MTFSYNWRPIYIPHIPLRGLRKIHAKDWLSRCSHWMVMDEQSLKKMDLFSQQCCQLVNFTGSFIWCCQILHILSIRKITILSTYLLTLLFSSGRAYLLYINCCSHFFSIYYVFICLNKVISFWCSQQICL